MATWKHLSKWMVVLISILCAPIAGAIDQENSAREPAAIRISSIDVEDIAKLDQLGFDLGMRGSDYVELLARPADLERLAAMGYEWQPLKRDLFSGARGVSDEGNLDPLYHTYQEMLDELMALAADYPNICHFYDIGDCLSKSYTWDNYSYARDVFAVRISDNPDMDEPEPCVIYDGRHHAREPTTTELCMAIATYFCENYGELPEITDAVNNCEIWVVPMINADGHQWVEDIDPWWRKTLHDHDQDHHVDNYEGIDPNRNYDWNWYAGSWDSQTYGGPYPWSAPCVEAMRDLQNLHRAAINPTYHTYGNYLLYPFGNGVDPEPVVIDITDQYAILANYDNQQSTTANGSAKDWAYGAIGAVSFTVEIGTEFIPSGTQMLADVARNMPAAIWLAERLWGPSVQGTVTDSVAGIPLEATIHIPEIMDVYASGLLWDMVTEASTGYFCRMRPASYQTITLEVSCEGYTSKSVQVQTGGTAATVVNIELVPDNFDRGILQGMVTNLSSGGIPVPGADVAVIGGPTFQTAPDGSYVGYVDPGSYRVAVSHPSFMPDTSAIVTIVIGEVTEVDFALIDIAGPSITNTTEYPSTDDEVGPYVIETTITDMSALGAASLYYRTSGSPFVEVPLTPLGNDRYQGEIPGQSHVTVVQYYILARDEADNESTDPVGAPFDLYLFYVAPFVTTFEDDIETGAVGWSHYVVLPTFTDQWHLSTQQNHTAGGTTSWKCGSTSTGNYANLLDAGLETPAFELGQEGTLTFWHWIDAEASGAYPGMAYDGGIVELSIDGGPFVQITPEGGYSHTCRAGATPGPFPEGTPLFSGTHGWEEVVCDLSAYEGEARVRFRFGSDGLGGGIGWFVDDVAVSILGISSAVEDLIPAVPGELRCTRLVCHPSPVIGGIGSQIRYTLTQPSSVHLSVYDASGRLVRKIPGRVVAEGALHWDGRDDAGYPLGSGLYLMRLDSAERALATERTILLRR